MALNVVPCDRDQRYLLPPDVREWLPADHLAWFVIDAVSALDTSAFWADLRADGVGRPAYDPDMMLALLVYAYCRGERSARVIERRCGEDLAYRVIGANRRPDHATIARFRRAHQDALADCFVQVLALCARAGLVRLGLVALDGTKLRATAAMSANRTHAAIAAEVARILDEAEAVDVAEDALHGPGRRGDEPPAELADPTTRRERLLAAARQLEAEQAGRERAHAARLAARSERERATGKGIRGRRPQAPRARPDAKANTTDPDSRVMKTSLGYLQGYNAQAIVGEGQIVIAAELTNQASDLTQLRPLIEAAAANLAAAGVRRRPRTLVADAGYLSIANLTRRPDDPELLVATASARRSSQPAPKDPAPEIVRMQRALTTGRARQLYRRRSVLVEPVFGQIKGARRIDGFQRRGLAACASEWKLIALTHNLLKLWRSGRAGALLGGPAPA